MIEVLGVKLDFDFFDADCLEVYERENQRIVERINDPTQYEGKSSADTIRTQCRIVDEFFDIVFGQGTAETLFKGKSNLLEHMNAFGAVADAAMNSGKEIDAIKQRYSPNRAERRHPSKQNSSHSKSKKHGKQRNQ